MIEKNTHNKIPANTEDLLSQEEHMFFAELKKLSPDPDILKRILVRRRSSPIVSPFFWKTGVPVVLLMLMLASAAYFRYYIPQSSLFAPSALPTQDVSSLNAPAASYASDTDLDNDMAAIDSELNALNMDTANADQS